MVGAAGVALFEKIPEVGVVADDAAVLLEPGTSLFNRSTSLLARFASRSSRS